MILPYSTIENVSIAEARDQIVASEKRALKDIKIIDLIIQNGGELESRHGVYFFFSEKNECLYVGKNSSQQFVERIPWHFALSVDSYGNHFLKYYKKRYGLDSIFEAAKHTLDCKLLLMPVIQRDITKIEKLFRVFSDPLLNKLRAANQIKEKIPADTIVSDGIGML